MLICTWTVQHLNLPAQSPDSLTGSSKLRRTLKRAWTRVKWMVITLIAPEFLAGKAFQDFMMARKSRNQMRKFVGTDCVSWSLAHAYYANMGGFILKVDPEALINAEEASSQVCQCQSITATKSTVDGSEMCPYEKSRTRAKAMHSSKGRQYSKSSGSLSRSLYEEQETCQSPNLR
ncbi:hypothetical protein M7I_5521 [Glarea lozoyensis 74030]|uniref:Uncharacterized protein n=1 Tax=Glarea lozoyensis (strain ATCC 74030 / MF5533) TaxID=1104152 RepID=H0ES45_GLAL7|nr:hypothetical protein M7I_5521 [Glarea lozoyensis 74030]